MSIRTILWDADGVLINEDHSTNTELLDLIATLREDQGIRSLLATNQEADRTEYIRDEMQFGKLLDGMYSSAMLGVKKPSVHFYVKLLETEFANGFENPLEAVLYFDDKEANVIAARALGMHAYLFTENSDAVAALEHHGLL